jgi:ABC-type multidrug transport system ATPase subunit
MNLVAGITKTGTIAGYISYGQNSNQTPFSCVAYVECFDCHIEEFTVLQNLYFGAKLRIPLSLSYDEWILKCVEVAKLVGLDDALNVVVGSGLSKGISGGQMKLLSIAVELLALPRVLCLDEPTSGLDSVTSLQLTRCLHNLAVNEGKTIICTVHQPSMDMLRLMDRLLLLAEGGVVFAGDILSVGGYLETHGYLPPEGSSDNPVELVCVLMLLFTDYHYVQITMCASVRVCRP